MRSAMMATMVACCLVAVAANAQTSSRYGNLNTIAVQGCERLRNAPTLQAIDATLLAMESYEFLLLRNAVTQSRTDSVAALFGASGLDRQREQWARERSAKFSALADIRASGGFGRDSDPAIALAAQDIARLQSIRAERVTRTDTAAAAVRERDQRSRMSGGNLWSGSTIDSSTLDTNVATSQAALVEHIEQTGLATLDEIDAAIARRSSERSILQRGYDAVRSRGLEAEIAQLDARIADAAVHIQRLRDEGEAHRVASWQAHWAEQDMRNCAVARGRILGAAGAPPPPGPSWVPPAPAAPTVGAPVAPVNRTTLPTAGRLESHSAFAAPNDGSGWTYGQQLTFDLTYYQDGSVTGSLSGPRGAPLGTLSGRWTNGSARGRISLSDNVLQSPGSGGSGQWAISLPSGGQGRWTGSWCILSAGANRQVGRQFGMIYPQGDSIVIQRSSSDPLCS